MSNKLTTIEIAVPYKRAGNVITQKEVSFDVFKDGEIYILKPLLDETELAIANLPPELKFRLENNKPVSLRGIKDGNFHVIQDAANLLETHLFLS